MKQFELVRLIKTSCSVLNNKRYKQINIQKIKIKIFEIDATLSFL
jgi:hypothetical protein